MLPGFNSLMSSQEPSPEPLIKVVSALAIDASRGIWGGVWLEEAEMDKSPVVGSRGYRGGFGRQTFLPSRSRYSDISAMEIKSWCALARFFQRASRQPSDGPPSTLGATASRSFGLVQRIAPAHRTVCEHLIFVNASKLSFLFRICNLLIGIIIPTRGFVQQRAGKL